MAFHVGMKVECIKPSALGSTIRRLKLNDASVGGIYMVRRVGEHFGKVGLWLEEIINPISPIWNDEYGFLADRFRPIVERKTDISIFAAMLKREPAHA